MAQDRQYNIEDLALIHTSLQRLQTTLSMKLLYQDPQKSHHLPDELWDSILPFIPDIHKPLLTQEDIDILDSAVATDPALILNAADRFPAFCQYLFESIKRNGGALNIEVYSSHTQLNSAGIRELATFLTTDNTLTSLTLGGHFIDLDGIKALAEAIKYNTTLTNLNLILNAIETEGAKALGEALQSNKTLTSLNLYGNFIETEGAVALVEALSRNTNTALSSLDLSSNQIETPGVEAAVALTKALKHNTTLISLNLSGNQISCQDEEALADILKTNCAAKAAELDDEGASGTIAAAAAPAHDDVTVTGAGADLWPVDQA